MAIIRPTRVVLKYFNFEKDVDPNVLVRVFNFATKVNAKTLYIYIYIYINVFNYMLRYITSDWCHNYMLKFPNCTFSKLTQAFCKRHQKT